MVERSLVSPAITAIQGDIVLLEAEDDILHDQIATANTAIATANAEITVLQDDVISLEAANVTLHVQIATADNAIFTANAEIAALQDDVISLEAANVTLRVQIATADNAISTANADIAALQDDVISLEAANVTAVTAISALASLLEAANATISAAEATISTLSARVQVLEAVVPPVATKRIVFVTSEVYSAGAIGGLAGAYFKCQTLANRAGLNGKFKAWLSDRTGSPAQDFVKSDLPYVTTTGVKVANDWQDLITGDGSGYLDNAIAFDEKGDSTSGYVWTGTNVTGMPDSNEGNFCDNWMTSATSGGKAIAGSFSFTKKLWTSSGFAPCYFLLPLYCFEQ